MSTELDLQLIDRIVGPIADRMEGMDRKLDALVHLGERISPLEQGQDRTDKRLAAIEDNQTTMSAKQAKTEGQNQVISWLLGLIGAPVLVTLVGLGLAKLIG